MSRVCQAFSVAVFVIAQASIVSAQDSGTNARVFAQLLLGLAGEGSAEVEEGGQSQDIQGDLDPAVGVGAGADFGLHKHIALGGLFRYVSIGGDSSAEVAVLDFDGLPRLRYPFEKGEVYLGVPVGLSLFIPDFEGADTEVGWNISVILGALHTPSEDFGLFAEVGYWVHNYSDSNDVAGVRVDISTTFTHVGLSIGAAYVN